MRPFRHQVAGGAASAVPGAVRGAVPGADTNGADRSEETRNVWTSRRSLFAHGALLIWVPGCVVATWWQVNIALSGDSLGWAYSVMWPCFAIFGTVFWWFLVHDDPETVGSRGLRRLQHQAAAGRDDDDSTAPGELSEDEMIDLAEAEDPELAAYNRYLADLARRDRPKTWTRR